MFIRIRSITAVIAGLTAAAIAVPGLASATTLPPTQGIVELTNVLNVKTERTAVLIKKNRPSVIGMGGITIQPALVQENCGPISPSIDSYRTRTTLSTELIHVPGSSNVFTRTVNMRERTCYVDYANANLWHLVAVTYDTTFVNRVGTFRTEPKSTVVAAPNVVTGMCGPGHTSVQMLRYSAAGGATIAWRARCNSERTSIFLP